MNGIAFASPWVLAAAAALAIPVLAHLARHEDREGRGFPSLMFLHRVPFPTRARRRVKDRLLLALRALALLALVLAFARPYPLHDPAAAVQGARDTVVLLDVSYSMAAEDLFARARELAAAAFEETGPGERAALVLFDEDARVASPLDAPPAAAASALAAAAPGHRATDFGAALQRAGELLADSGAAVRRVVLISDLQQAGLLAGAALPRELELELRPVAASAGGNLAVTELGLAGRGRLRVLVRNTSAQTAASSLRVRVNGLDAAREPISLAAGSVREITLPVFPAADAVTRVAAFLDADALAADNERFLALEPPREVSALVVADDVGEERTAPYIAAALASATDPVIRFRQRTPAMLDAGSFEGVDLLLLDAPLPGASPLSAALARRIEDGMGVLAFASAAGGLPQSVPEPGSAERRTAGEGLFLVPTAQAHALSPALGEGVVAAGPVWRHRDIEVLTGDAILATFDDGTPAMVARARGRARGLTLATAPGETWSTLGRRPEFAPWLARSAAWLAGVDASPSGHRPGGVLDVAAYAAASASGAGLTAALARGERLSVRRPSGRVDRPGPSQPLVLDEPGFHELRTATTTHLWVPVNVAAAESELSPLSPQQFLARVQRPTGAPREPAHDVTPPADPAWAWLLAALAAGLLLCESLLAARMAHRPAAAAA